MAPPGVSWLGRHRAQLRLGVRMMAASLLAFAFCRLLGLAQSYAAVLTAIIVTQSSVGASLNAMADRFVGSLGGAVWGVIVSISMNHGNGLSLGLALTVCLAPLALLAAVKPAYRAAPVTAVILILAPATELGSLAPAIQRMLEIALGSIAALGVALLILPVRAHGILADAAGRALVRMGDLAAQFLDGVSGHGDTAAIQQLHDEIRRAIAQAEAAADEAARERTTYLTAAPDPRPICRTLRRIRNDLVMIGRTTAEPFSEPVANALGGPVADAGRRISVFLRDSGHAVSRQDPLPSLQAVSAAIAEEGSAVVKLRKERVTRDLSEEGVGQVFGLGFGLEQLRHDLEDLVDRADELAGRRTRGAAVPAATLS
jgi:hypothetical protein